MCSILNVLLATLKNSRLKHLITDKHHSFIINNPYGKQIACSRIFFRLILAMHFNTFGYNNKNNALVCKNANTEAHYSQGFYSKGSEQIQKAKDMPFYSGFT